MDTKAAFTVTNINETLKKGREGEEDLQELFRGFVCPRNPDVERFFREQSVDFTKRSQSVTYIITEKVSFELVAYFTLAIKPISVNAGIFSRTVRRKIQRVAKVNEQTGEYLVAAFLIAQLGKNFADGANKLISGAQLLDLALDAIRELQFRAGGTVVFLEADDNPKLISFYEANGFKQFGCAKATHLTSTSWYNCSGYCSLPTAGSATTAGAHRRRHAPLARDESNSKPRTLLVTDKERTIGYTHPCGGVYGRQHIRRGVQGNNIRRKPRRGIRLRHRRLPRRSCG